MRQVTITLPDDLDDAFEAFRRDQVSQPDLAELAEAALREYLAGRGYLLSGRPLPPYRPFRITPLPPDDGPTDMSVNHDRYLADLIEERKLGGPR